ncbi:MAG: hypothetical protein GY845_11115 [Planctomycetes bacterium]|nr:hypothetical protein [Planctomycetota bacterium]
MTTNIAHFEMIPIDEIVLDKENSRIVKWIEMYGDDVRAEDMTLALGTGDRTSGDKGTTFSSLKQSILINRVIIHPIIVNRGLDGTKIVIEGNTRLALYLEFRDGQQNGNWNTIPAMVYENMGQDAIDAIRLQQAHLVGTRAWDPYSKARYLDASDKTAQFF